MCLETCPLRVLLTVARRLLIVHWKSRSWAGKPHLWLWTYAIAEDNLGICRRSAASVGDPFGFGRRGLRRNLP